MGLLLVGGDKVYNPIKLNRIYKHYYGIDIQPQDQAHSAFVDAEATMKLFREQYMPWALEQDAFVKYSDKVKENELFDMIQ